MRTLGRATLLALLASLAHAADETALKVYSAGSLREPLTKISQAYTAAYGTKVDMVFGASGALAKRLADGERGDFLTSADRGGPETLSSSGKSGPAVSFARNRLCAIVRPGLRTSTATIIDTLLVPGVRLSTSNPQDDPGGAYAWAMFKRADTVQPGSRAKLEAKTIILGNGPGMLTVPPGTSNTVAWRFTEKQIDVFVSYCTNGHQAESALTGLSTVELPLALAVTATYGMTVLKDAKPEASRLALFILSSPGQKILANAGFDAPLTP